MKNYYACILLSSMLMVGCAKVGDNVQQYESGNTGPYTISTGRGDPGGISYGTYQLSSRSGTLQAFLKYTGYYIEFKGLKPGTEAFKNKWNYLVLNTAGSFAYAQFQYIYYTHYLPVRSYASSLGLAYSKAINEALWSISIQHGAAKRIVRRAAIKGTDTELEQIKKLYVARKQYVLHLKLSKALKRVLLSRYNKEIQDIIDLIV